jgi:hypothetical protein
MELARRLNRLPPYLFVEINRRLVELRAQGKDIVDFGIGDPIYLRRLILLNVCARQHMTP